LKKSGFSISREVQKQKAQLAKKKPDFLEADLVRKSRAFGNLAKEKAMKMV